MRGRIFLSLTSRCRTNPTSVCEKEKRMWTPIAAAVFELKEHQL